MSSATGEADRAGLDAAFARCRAIAKREAKNFYYAVVALPRAKSDAMCAMYAFMRRADDIADDEAVEVAERRRLMRLWLCWFHESSAADGNDGQAATELAPTADDRLVFAAVRETQRRVGSAGELLDELVSGTAMGLAAALAAGVARGRLL